MFIRQKLELGQKSESRQKSELDTTHSHVCGSSCMKTFSLFVWGTGGTEAWFL